MDRHASNADRKMNCDQLKKLVAMNAAGITGREIAVALGFTPETISHYVTKLGLPKRTDTLHKEVLKLHHGGKSTAEIAFELGLKVKAVTYIKHRYSLKSSRGVSEAIKSEVIDLSRGGLSLKEISERVRLSIHTICKIRKAAGIRMRESREGKQLTRSGEIKSKRRRLHLTKDATFAWVRSVCVADPMQASPMEEWRKLAEEYLSYCNIKRLRAYGARLNAMRMVLEKYLWRHGYTDPASFFVMRGTLPPLSGTTDTALFNDTGNGVRNANYTCDFFEWVLENKYSSDEDGRRIAFPGHRVPVARVPTSQGRRRNDETVRAALPYKYLRLLREMLAEGPHFKDWKWAQSTTGMGTGNQAGDWFEVDENLIDETDPDCVWRRRIRKVVNYQLDQPDPAKGTKEVVDVKEVHEIWSPVSAVALLAKLEMPWRTFQERMLDSGEADLERVDLVAEVEADLISGGHTTSTPGQSVGRSLFRWSPNAKRAVLLANLPIDQRNRVSGEQGVFSHCFDSQRGEFVGFFVNTNKTADIDKDWRHRGYHIRWQHDSLLRWLIKLRNWQERYNPIVRPTLWTELENKHYGPLAKSQAHLEEAAPTCFLFRDASAQKKWRHEDAFKPIAEGKLGHLWCRLLCRLEEHELKVGARDPSGNPIRFIKGSMRKPSDIVSTYFPLHALRVSLITVWSEGGVPLETLMKIAGHSRLVMTIYYLKCNHAIINKQLEAAHNRLIAEEEPRMIAWLMNQSYEQLSSYVVADDEGLRSAIPKEPRDRTTIRLERVLGGYCMMGGNTSPIAGHRHIGGCFNGGKAVTGTSAIKDRVFGSVRPKCCIEGRCRWFVTRPEFLLEIKYRMDLLCTRLSDAERYHEAFSGEFEALHRERHEAAKAGVLFNRQTEYDNLNRQVEKSSAEIDYLLDGISSSATLAGQCVRLMSKSLPGGDPAIPEIIAQGSPEDVSTAAKALERDSFTAAGLSGDAIVTFSEHDREQTVQWTLEAFSELTQLTSVSENAESCPELRFESTGAIIRRSQLLELAMARKGFTFRIAALTPDDQMRVGNRLVRELARPLGGNLAAAVAHIEANSAFPATLAAIARQECASCGTQTLTLATLTG